MSKRLSILRKNFKKYDKMWPEQFVPCSDEPHFPQNNLLSEYFELLDKKCDENTIHKFLEKNPIILSSLLCGKGKWVFSKPRFGCEYIPDFLLCTEDSAGYHWAFVELESPNKKALRKNGQQTADISTALKQINEWRIWIRNNISYACYELGFIDINAECNAVIVIGRRKNISPKFKELYNELSKENLKIMSYDRLGHRT